MNTRLLTQLMVPVELARPLQDFLDTYVNTVNLAAERTEAYDKGYFDGETEGFEAGYKSGRQAAHAEHTGNELSQGDFQ